MTMAFRSYSGPLLRPRAYRFPPPQRVAEGADTTPPNQKPVRCRRPRINTKARRIDMTLLRNLWNDEQGQDLIEYTLLMAFVALASAALFLGAGGSIKGIWTVTNSQLAAASTQAS